MSENISVTVSFFSTLRNVTGVPQTQMNITKGEELVSLLKAVENQFFQPKSAKLLNNNCSGLEAGIICLLDDADMTLSGGLHQKLTSSCVITLISSLHGG
jgi:molybdopterin converting factor small subunit